MHYNNIKFLLRHFFKKTHPDSLISMHSKDFCFFNYFSESIDESCLKILFHIQVYHKFQKCTHQWFNGE